MENNLEDFCRGCCRRGYLENKKETCDLCEYPTCSECSYEHPELGHICYIHPVFSTKKNAWFRGNLETNIEDKIFRYQMYDMKRFGKKGDVDVEYILERLDKQNGRCYICRDFVQIVNWAPKCEYQFSIDRINSDLPHDKDNVLIACKYCNCRMAFIKKCNYDNYKICKEGCHTIKRNLPTKWDILQQICPDEECYKI